MSSANATTSDSKAQSTTKLASNFDSQQVADFLRCEPDFFRQHPDVLAGMTLPHASGNAVSLVERQVAILRERSMQTRHKLGELLDIAKDNDALFAKTQALVVALLQSTSTAELIAVTQQHFSQQFFVELTNIMVITDAPEQLAALIDAQHLRSEAEAGAQIASLLNPGPTLCGVLREAEAEFIFSPANEATHGSAAVATRSLQLSATENGATLLLAVAHHDSDHYNRNTGRLFIDHIADILQILFVQVLNRG
ncbi:MAG: DUF484 family protein [Pseudomonadales bacterium]|nr:DUF484 family protein [Pseudomonadales bacterium]